MLEGFDIILLAFADWRASWTTPQQIATRLAPQNRVLYVDVPRSLFFFLKKADPQGAGLWEGERTQEIRTNLHVYHPPHVFLPTGYLPLPLAKRTLDLNGRLLARLVTRVARDLRFSRPIIWNFSLLHGHAVARIERCINVYDSADEWTSYLRTETGRRIVQWLEEKLCREADVVLVGTENMKAARETFNAETHVVHHAADYAHFAKAALPDTPIPRDIADLPRPLVGTIGVIDPARFDVDLIRYLATQRPQWSIVLVGPARADMDLRPLHALNNVHLLGNRPIAELPSYLKGFDVAFVPYKVNDATRGIYPLKLHEYLAAAKPVVSAALPAVVPYADVVAVASSHADFLAKVEQCLKEEGTTLPQARQAVARHNSWEQRIEEKSRHILRILQRRKEGAV